MSIYPGQSGWPAVEPHLDRLLEMPEAQWEAYLAAIGIEQPETAAALREMLADHQALEAQGFLETNSPGIAAADLSDARVGAYTIRSLIGRGGMGEVWLAQRSDGRFEGQFAVKFLDRYSASPAALERFRREGRLLARLAHPHIARLIDAGVTTSGRPYLILEYVQGERIDEYCHEHSLDITARVRLSLEVLDALAHAHANLVIHRDIKPSNILVTATGHVKLLDFGVAKLLGSESGTATDTPLTRLEESAFTPEFAAPEQILGDTPSTATDVYQVGVLLFLLLTGRLPFATEGATRAERIREALDHEPRRLSDAAPIVDRPKLRGDLDAIVSKAMRKLPQERYATAAALGDDLKRYLNNEPVAARENLVGYRVRKFVRRHRGAVIGTCAALFALLATTGFALFQMREAQLQRDHSRAQATRAELQSEFVTLMMSTVGTHPTTAEQLLDAGSRLLAEHYTSDPTFRVSAMINLSSRYSDLGLTQKQLALLQQADTIARQVGDAALMARSQCALSGPEIDQGHLDRGAALADSGKNMLARVSHPDPLFVEDCIEAEADVASAQGNPATATLIDQQALTLLEQQHATQDERYPELLGRIADYYKQVGNTKKGFEYTEAALNAFERDGLGDTDTAMTALHNVASSLSGFGEIKEACAREKEVVTRLQSTGRDIVPPMAALFGTCLLRTGQPTEALTWYDRAVATAQAEHDAPLQIYAHASRARALIALRRLGDAQSELDHADALAANSELTDNFQSLRKQLVRVELLAAQLSIK